MIVNAYSTVVAETTRPGMGARRRTSPQGLTNDELVAHLQALEDWILESADTDEVDELLEHLDLVRWQYTIDVDPADLGGLSQWAENNSSVLVLPGPTRLTDPWLRPLVGEDSTGRVPVLPERVQRAERIRNRLAAKSVRVPASLPPVRSEREIELRSPAELAARTVALVLTADYAVSVIEESPLDASFMAETFPKAWRARTASERRLFAHPDPVLARELMWGYESAAILLWAAGRMPITPPSEMAEIRVVWDRTVGTEEGLVLQKTRLRSVAEIVDEFELMQSLSSALAEHENGNAPVVPEADPDVVLERHKALAWLCDRSLTWDDEEDD